MAKPGPQPLGYSVELRTMVSPEIARALAQLVGLSGVSKATLIRHSLLATLTTMGFVYPEVRDSLVATRTAGRVTFASAPERN
jgi:hypothetical protein